MAAKIQKTIREKCLVCVKNLHPAVYISLTIIGILLVFFLPNISLPRFHQNGNTFNLAFADFSGDFYINTLHQYQFDCNTHVATGSAVSASPSAGLACLVGSINVGSSSGSLTLEVEVQPLSDSFTNTATHRSEEITSTESAALIHVLVPDLVLNESYHWQARTVDSNGLATSWISFGGNIETVSDFNVQLPEIEWQVASSSATEADIAPRIYAVLSAPSFEEILATYAINASSTAILREDHDVYEGTVIIVSGETSASLTLNIINDISVESSETLILDLSDPINASLAATTSHIYTILDDDTIDSGKGEDGEGTDSNSPNQGSSGPTPTLTLTPTRTPTPTASNTPIPTNTLIPTLTPTRTPTPTVSNTPVPTSTPIFTPTSTPVLTATAIPSATANPTNTPTITLTPTPTGTLTSNLNPTLTPTVTPIRTPTPTPTSTSVVSRFIGGITSLFNFGSSSEESVQNTPSSQSTDVINEAEQSQTSISRAPSTGSTTAIKPTDAPRFVFVPNFLPDFSGFFSAPKETPKRKELRIAYEFTERENLSFDVKITITNEDNKSVSGVNVKLSEVEELKITDSKGIVVFRDIQAGEYQITVTHEGVTETEVIFVQKDTQAALKRAIQTLSVVVLFIALVVSVQVVYMRTKHQ